MTITEFTAAGTPLPLLFSYRDTLFGNGFVVEVQATNGRALCQKESDGLFWMYGVNPGGMAAHGDTPEDAHVSFRKTFTAMLVDIALESESFDVFRASVQEFFDETNAGYEVGWTAAVEQVRQERITIAGLSKAPADSPRSVSVSMKQTFQAADNRHEMESQVAA